MMSRVQEWLAFCGRLLLGLGFVGTGFGQIVHWDKMISHLSRSPLRDTFSSEMIPVVLVFAILIQVVAGSLLCLGWKTRPASFFLSTLMILVILWMRHFWTAAPNELFQAYDEFTEDSMVLGGVLLLLAFGPGKISIDRG